jgi:hypothetical protein
MIDHAEDRGACADAQRERQDCHEGKPRRAREGAEGVRRIAPQVVEPHKGARVALCVLRRLDTSERAPGRTPRVVEGQPSALKFLLEECEMCGDFA